jgi:GT2 family glycosyltransferase
VISPAKVSAIIATSRRAELAIRSLRSLLANDYPNLEAVVVDQDPQHRLESLIQSAFPGESRLVYVWVEGENLSRARNAGVSRATGDILVFLDDDAIASPGLITAYAAAFDGTQPLAGAIAGRLDPDFEVPRPEWLTEEALQLLGIYQDGSEFHPMRDDHLPMGANFAVPRVLFDSCGPFDERLGYSYSRRQSMLAGEDSLLSLRIKRAGNRLYHVPAAVARHRIAAAKLRFSYLLRRYYWEGVTQLTLLYLTGQISRASVPGIVKSHCRRLFREALKGFVRHHVGDSRWPSRKKLVGAACECLRSVGTIVWAGRLATRGSLP